MRLAEDMEVAEATRTGQSRVDLLLGGHDHEVVRRFGGDTNTDPATIEQSHNNEDIRTDGFIRDAQGDIRIIKSGTDWRGLSLVRMMVEKDEKGSMNVSSVEVRQWSNIEGAASLVSIPTSGISALLDSIHSRVDALVQKPLLHSGTSLDGRGSVVRSEETNLGNMLANAVRAFYDTDIAFFNSGSIRCDQVLGPTIPNGSPLRLSIREPSAGQKNQRWNPTARHGKLNRRYASGRTLPPDSRSTPGGHLGTKVGTSRLRDVPRPAWYTAAED
ncbi:predicted protein [Aspergillus terreus NIH2624]|uniref:5'-Nucleotidase C-terminal domain-containing protein n=1 Tax=Aspergillus terreus (strain NIH 2624 / FGSC A1156) TaxID=341663 RepID=Q0CQC0_ASPTN|nr:uncharacterized protein ATEG_04114 [Aspergillus terreus NIH2624]EAU35916.1 predicted protein [Aspergillus terreus NIH2624]